MAAEEEKSSDFYGVMGLKKECTPAELRNAYKKLAMKWHPDRCSASANQKYVEQAKKKFQDIQQAYSVLSDANKRFLYDVGVYNSDDDDDDENGMGDFLNEMASMMNQTKSNESKNESFEDLQQLFQEIFRSETADALCSSFSSSSRSTSPPSCASSRDSDSKTSKKRKGFCIREKTMAGGGGGGGGSRKQKVSDVSSCRRGMY